MLRDNAEQSLAVSLEERAGAEALPAHAALMQRLEAAGVLDRSVAGLPDAAAMAARMAAGDALTRPGIAALLPLAKLWLNEAIEAGPLPDDPAFAPVLAAYFPRPLRERYAEAIARHRLRRDLVAMAITNGVANRLGCAGLARLAAQADPAAAARAAWLAAEVFGLEDAADGDRRGAGAGGGAARRAAARCGACRSRRRTGSSPCPTPPATRWRTRGGAAAGHRRAAGGCDGRGRVLAAGGGVARRRAAGRARGAGRGGAPLGRGAGHRAARGDHRHGAGRGGLAWGAVGSELGLDALQQATAAAPAPGAFGARAKAALLDDLTAAQARLAAARLAGGDGGRAAAGEEHAAAAALAREAALAGDLAAVTVAARALSMLA